MRISLLLQREPFGGILCRTLERFLSNLRGGRYSVRWRPQRPSFRGSVEGAQRWLCNRYLNAIFLPGSSRSDLEPVIREFSRSPSILRRLPQRVYVAVATHRYGAMLAADAYMEVSPPVADAEHWLIVGGNHKLRILDRPAGKTIAILKDGFDARRFKTELSMRRLAERAGLPVPSIGRVGEDESWFEEPYVLGTPLNRLADPHEAARAVKRVADALVRFSLDSREELAVADYIAPLLAECRQLADRGRLIRADPKARIESSLHALERRLAGSAQRRVATGLAHGDFQPANILKDGDELWLIDWEFSGRRQLGDDGLVYGLGVRRPQGLADRLRRFVQRAPDDPLLEGWPGTSWENEPDRELAALILVLEELSLWLEESTNPNLVAIHPSTYVLVEEIERWLTQ